MSRKRKKEKRGEPGSPGLVARGNPGEEGPSTATRKEDKDASPPASQERTGFDVFRENAEALVVAVILALIIRHFAVEAFEIPTGSMAPTLYGIHAWLKCPNCSTDFNVALKSDSSTGNVTLSYPPTRVYDGPCGNLECPVKLHRADNRSDQVLCGACGAKFSGRHDKFHSTDAITMRARCPICEFEFNTLLERSNQTGGHKILVTKFAYTVSHPRRWDIIVFAFDQHKNYIKRLVGLPGERIDIWDGDIYVNGEIERKSKHPYVQDVLWTKISDTDVRERGLRGHPPAWRGVAPKESGLIREADKVSHWDPTALRWSVNAKGDTGVLEYQRKFDNYYNYNLAQSGFSSSTAGTPEGVLVGDKKVAFTVRPARGGSAVEPTARGPRASWVGAEIRDRDFTFQLRLPIGEASKEAPAVIERMVSDDGENPSPLRAAHPDPLRLETPLALPFEALSRVEFENVDDRVAARINGKEVLSLEYSSLPAELDVRDPAASPPAEIGAEIGSRRGHYIRIFVVNAQAEVESIQAFRDMYYIDYVPGYQRPWPGLELDQEEYLPMGDNAPSSSDGRAWGYVPEKNLMGKAFVVFWPAWPWNFQWQRIR